VLSSARTPPNYRIWNFALTTRPAFRRQRYQAETSFIGTQRRSSLVSWGVLAAHPPDPPLAARE